MKKIKYLSFLFLLFSFITSGLNAQTVGHLNFQTILLAMPEYKTASDEYELYKAALEDELKLIEAEAVSINKKYEIEAAKPVPNQTRLKIYANQIQSMQMEYQAKEQSIKDSLQYKMNDLITPLRKKIEDAVAAIAKERGFTHVIDNTSGLLLYADEAYNIESEVKKRLNITEKPSANPGAGKTTPRTGGGSR